MSWNAWFYYQTAAYLLDPAEFLSSPNLEKLQRETDQIRPDTLPGTKPLMLNAPGGSFEIMEAGTTVTFGTLDLEIHYNPSTAQLSQLHDPTTARQQVVAVMTALLTAYPELREAFHGVWVRADQGTVSVFALDLPMDQITSGTSTQASANPVAR
jgi:hypothetical protein